jgi:death-on-curing protein
LARARQRWAYDESSDVAALTAAYGYGLARNHSFNDGNKRIALMTMDLFAGLNGYAIDTSEEDVVVTMLVLAAGELTEPVLAGWLRGCLVRTVGRGG